MFDPNLGNSAGQANGNLINPVFCKILDDICLKDIAKRLIVGLVTVDRVNEYRLWGRRQIRKPIGDFVTQTSGGRMFYPGLAWATGANMDSLLAESGYGGGDL